MHPGIKLQLIGRTLGFRTKFAQETITDKSFEKININILISI